MQAAGTFSKRLSKESLPGSSSSPQNRYGDYVFQAWQCAWSAHVNDAYMELHGTLSNAWDVSILECFAAYELLCYGYAVRWTQEQPISSQTYDEAELAEQTILALQLCYQPP